MESQNRYEGIHPHAEKTVRYQARRLASGSLFQPWEIEDIEQVLMLDLHKRLQKFDPDRSLVEGFIFHIVVNHANTLIESALTEKRGGGQMLLSLNAPIKNDQDDSEIEWIETFSNQQGLWPKHGKSWDELAELRLDLERNISLLPRDMRMLVIRLSKETIGEISNATGVPRSTLHDQVAQIRNHMWRAVRKKSSKNLRCFF